MSLFFVYLDKFNRLSKSQGSGDSTQCTIINPLASNVYSGTATITASDSVQVQLIFNGNQDSVITFPSAASIIAYINGQGIFQTACRPLKLYVINSSSTRTLSLLPGTGVTIIIKSGLTFSQNLADTVLLGQTRTYDIIIQGTQVSYELVQLSNLNFF